MLDAVVRHRQDLLDLLLAVPQRLKGRFLTGDTRLVPVIVTGHDRWHPRQVTAYAAALKQLIATPATPAWTAVSAIGALARLPEVGAAAVQEYLTVADTVRVEAALGALAWTDRPQDACLGARGPRG